jgi:3-methyladenine DNA glycosylase AlkD
VKRIRFYQGQSNPSAGNKVTMSKTRSFRSLAASVNAGLRTLGSAEAAEQGRSYFKPGDEIWLHGVRTPDLRSAERKFYLESGKSWSLEEAVRCCEALLRYRYLETKGVGIMLLSRFKGQFTKELFTRIESWLAADLCNNWASADSLALSILAPLLARHPELIQRLSRWAHSRNLWLRRSAAVGLVPLARKGVSLDAAYFVARALLGGREDLIHKGVGWLLRESGKTDPERLKDFLLANGSHIPRTAVRYAIERFPAPTRKALLAATRFR